MTHISVLLNEAVEGLNIKPDGIYVDLTLGGGGHSQEILKKLTTGKLICIDRDKFAIDIATEKLKEYTNKTIIKNSFVNIDEVLKQLSIDKVDGFLLDLGVSSFQFDDGERGFSYNKDYKLDMRMDREEKLSAYEVVNNFTEDDLYKIFRDYGEEKFAKNIAKHIVLERAINKIETTFQLVEIIKQSIPAKLRQNEKHPAKRVFQALRIYVNDELSQLTTTLDKIIDLLNDKGRISIITFHSLEDRIVKNKFKIYENPCTCPKGYPCVCGKKPKGIIITKKAILPTEEEIDINRRSKSAKLRIFERRYDNGQYKDDQSKKIF